MSSSINNSKSRKHFIIHRVDPGGLIIADELNNIVFDVNVGIDWQFYNSMFIASGDSPTGTTGKFLIEVLE